MGLVQVEGEQRCAAAVADQDHPVVPLAGNGERGRSVEQDLLVDERGVVVEPPARHVEHGDPGLEERGGRVMVGEVGPWVHEDRDRRFAAACV